MKTSIVYLVIGLLLINSLSAQVKIGDNPQNLNPASLLELESTTRALVITRVNDAQMSTINPLRGAVVYNTDKECLHYFNGSAWINICEALDDSFTVSTRADSLRQVNPQARENTIAILQSTNPDGSTNYNFEVYRITGANIVDTSINADSKLQDGTVTRRKLAEDAVGLSNLADASSAGDLYMYNGSAWNFVNRADLLNTQLDSIVGNEVVGPFDTTLRLEGDGDATPYTLDVSEDGITAFEIATGAVTTDEILNGTIITEDILDDAITTDKIATGAVESTDIAANAVNAATINIDVAGTGLAQAADGSLIVDNATIAPDWTNISGIPADIDDGDDDTTYTAGTGLQLTGTSFSVDNATIAPDWTNISGIPADIDDGDDDTTYTAGLGININGTNEISTTNLGGDVTGPINATVIGTGVIDNSNIAAGAGIEGSKINPIFNTDVTTTGDFIDLTPDFVFQKYFNGYSSLNDEYEFKSLDEIESFIKKNNHLPGVKSAYEIKAEGRYHLTESSMAQLEKIEELFLHTIEQEKKIDSLQSDNQKLTEELNFLKTEIKEIKTMLLDKSKN